MRGTLLSLWRRLLGGLDSKGFVRLVQTHTLSSAGDALVAVALAGSIFFSEDPNTARTRVALSLALTMAPFALVAPFLGPAIDRLKGGRRFIICCASAARALLCLLMATSLDNVALYPIAFLSLVFSKTHAVAKSALVPEIIRTDTALVKANSVLAVSAVISGFIAGGIGYGFSALAGDEWTLRVGALLFVVGAALSIEVSSGHAIDADEESGETLTRLRDTGVLVAGAVMAVLRTSVGFLTFLIAFDLRRAGASTAWFGLAISGGLIGSSVGNLLGPRLRKLVREELMLTVAVLVVCVAAIVISQMPTRIAGVVLAFILGMCTSAAKLGFDSLVQRDAPSAAHGRSFARFEAGFQLVWVLGALVPVTFTMSTSLGYWLLAAACGSAALWYSLSPKRRVGTP